jgi:hypothetical protein
MKKKNPKRKRTRTSSPAKRRGKPAGKPRSSATRISEDGAERTVQHLSLPDEVTSGMKQEATKMANRRVAEKKKAKPRVGAIWDRACSQFTSRFATKPCTSYVFPHKAAFRSVWIDSRILEKCREMATRDGVTVARVLHTAAVLFLDFKNDPSG